MIDEAKMRRLLEEEREDAQALIARLTQGIDEVSAAREISNQCSVIRSQIPMCYFCVYVL